MKTVKAFSVVLSILIIFSCFAFINISAFAEVCDGFEYRLEGGAAVLTGLESSIKGDVSVPSKLDGYNVTKIDRAFKNKTKIKSVILPDTVTVITQESFAYCSALKSIVLSNNLLLINESAFSYCTSLESIVIPDSVVNIEQYAFFGCESLTAVTFSANMKTIKKGTFYACSSLADISIPENINVIEQNAFTDTAYYNNSDNWQEDVLYLDNHLVRAKTSLSGRYELKDDTKCIAQYAFSSCKNLKEVVFNKSLVRIGESAFYNCKGLTDVYYPYTIKKRNNLIIEDNNTKLIRTITWHYKEYKPGDINADDSVDNKDLTRLFQYLSNWDVETEETVRDVNGDKSVDNKDLTRLFQYLSDWDVEAFVDNSDNDSGGDDYSPIVTI